MTYGEHKDIRLAVGAVALLSMTAATCVAVADWQMNDPVVDSIYTQTSSVAGDGIGPATASYILKVVGSNGIENEASGFVTSEFNWATTVSAPASPGWTVGAHTCEIWHGATLKVAHGITMQGAPPPFP